MQLMVAVDGKSFSPLNINSLKNVLNVRRVSFPHNGVTFLDCVAQTRQRIRLNN